MPYGSSAIAPGHGGRNEAKGRCESDKQKSGDTLQIIATGTELLSATPNPIQRKHSVRFYVPFLVLVAECREVSLEYLVELVPPSRAIQFMYIKSTSKNHLSDGCDRSQIYTR